MSRPITKSCASRSRTKSLLFVPARAAAAAAPSWKWRKHIRKMGKPPPFLMEEKVDDGANQILSETRCHNVSLSLYISYYNTRGGEGRKRRTNKRSWWHPHAAPGGLHTMMMKTAASCWDNFASRLNWTRRSLRPRHFSCISPCTGSRGEETWPHILPSHLKLARANSSLIRYRFLFLFLGTSPLLNLRPPRWQYKSRKFNILR